MESEQAAELARGKDEDGFIWIGLFEPSEDEFAEDPLAFLRDVDDHLKLVNEELVGQRESLAVVLQTPSPAIRVSSGQGGSARSQKSLIAGSTLLAHEQIVGGQSLAEVGVGIAVVVMPAICHPASPSARCQRC